MSSTDTTSSNGSAWAAILSAAVGCVCFGFLADLSEISKQTISPLLTFYKPTGDLSGKSTLAVVVWVAAWIVLHLRWKQQNLQRTGMLATITLILVLLALVETFPPTFELLSGK